MKKILLGVTGSIAAFKSAALCSKLVQAGYEVRVVLTKGALEFVGAATFEGLTGSLPLTTGFEAGSRMAHIHWERWADLTLVYPASAHTITRLAHGDGSDLLGTLFLAHDFKTPYWIAPAMNPTMLGHPAVREAAQKLATFGVRVLESDSGRTACGEVGTGRLLEPEAMLAEIETYFGVSKSKTEKKILITAGGTSEKIDSVRVLTNTSTGATGLELAHELMARGHRVTLLLSENSVVEARPAASTLIRFGDFQSLDRAMREALTKEKFDTVIHAAAVSDYSVDSIETKDGKKVEGAQKIHSGEPLTLALKPNPKIVNRLRGYSANPRLKVISFKLTVGGEKTPELSAYDSDYVVHNDLSQIDRKSGVHAGVIYRNSGAKRGERLSAFATKRELATQVAQLIEKEGEL